MTARDGKKGRTDMLKGVTPQKLKSYTASERNVLCDELRLVIYETVTKSGGHLSSNLGAVELSVALCTVFDFPCDKIVFDVGHQCYPYKLLTGRYERFSTLRKKGGVSGFPKRTESEYDCYDTGHAGTALSAAIGIAKARDLQGKDYAVIAFVGDGSFNNGLVYEALNSLRVLNTNVLIILNDNGMSISPTVGGMHDILTQIKEGNRAENVKLLESFSLTYLGVKDGNDVEETIEALQEAKELLKTQSVLLHVVTKKGKGYEFSEEHPAVTHGVPPVGALREREYSDVLGETLVSLADKNDKIVAVTAAMTESLGLAPFFSAYPERAFDVGICEENACILCSSMASGGLKPYYAIFSTFLQRAFDEIVHDVCSQDLPVTFCIDRAGISGADGETHQGVFDLSYLSFVPNLTIASPKDTQEFEKILRWSERFPHPLAIRYPRCGKVIFSSNEESGEEIKLGKWEYLHRANEEKLTIVATGERCLLLGMNVKKSLNEKGLDVGVVNARFVKPLDRELLENLTSSHVVTLEDNVKIGGFGQAVCNAVREIEERTGKKYVCKNFAYADSFIPQGTICELQTEYGLNEEEIEKYIESVLA